MKNFVSTLVVFGLMGCAITNCRGQSPTNLVETEQNGFTGARLLAKPAEDQFPLGSPMPMSITVTNTGNRSIFLMDSLSETVDYRIAVFSLDGTAATTATAIAIDPSKMGPSSAIQIQIKPGQSASKNIDLARFIRFDAEGAYYIMIRRSLWVPEEASIVSGKVKINVVAPHSAKPEK